MYSAFTALFELDEKTRPDLSQTPAFSLLASITGEEIGKYGIISVPDINLDMIRIHSTTIWHELAVICLASYLVLQNAFGITDVTNNYFEPVYAPCVNPIRYTAYAFLLPCTIVAVLLSKALKIIEIPRKVASWGQETLLREIEKELVKRKNNKTTGNEFVVAISKEEFDKEIVQKAEAKYGFYYTLNILAKRYNTTLSLLIINSNQSLDIAMTTFLKVKNLEASLLTSPEICVSPYSTQYISSTPLLQACGSGDTISTTNITPPPSPFRQNEVKTENSPDSISSLEATSSYTLLTPSFGSRRLWSAYAPKVDHSVIAAEVSFYLFSTIYLGIIPVLVSVLQGGGTLAKASGVDENSPWATQLEIFLTGACIGLIRGWVTYKQKSEDAEEHFRVWFSALFNLLGSVSTLPEKIISFLSWIYSCRPSSVSEGWTRIKQFFCVGFGVYAALGTVVFYAGLGFFFSNSGLITATRLMGLPNLSTVVLFSISANFCLGQVLLNAIGNQGPDIIYRYWLRALGKHKNETATARTCAERGLSTAVKGDAISTGLSADSGALALIQLLWALTPRDVTIGVSFSICLALVFSQNTFAWTSGKKDYHLWALLWNERYKLVLNKVHNFFCCYATKKENTVVPELDASLLSKHESGQQGNYSSSNNEDAEVAGLFPDGMPTISIIHDDKVHKSP